MPLCEQCKHAADAGLPPEEHCGDDRCMCGHRPPSRRPATDAATTDHDVADGLRRAAHYAEQLAARQRRDDGEQP
jgi:hypothetical protein